MLDEPPQHPQRPGEAYVPDVINRICPAALGTGLLSLHLVVKGTKRSFFAMDREHVKGTADKAKGAIKDAAGKVTGNKKLQAKGKLDKAKGSAHKAAGDVKDKARNASDE